MATVTKETKYSYLEKEIRIVLFILATVLIISYLIIQRGPQWLPNDESELSVIVFIAIIAFNNIFKWTIWKLAGGWKE